MSAQFNTQLQPGNRLKLQTCGHCSKVNYPPRELCGNCLSDELHWQTVADTGVVQSRVALHYSLEPVYAGLLPWEVASIRLDCGPVALSHLQPGVKTGDSVTLRVIQDKTGNRMLAAIARDPENQRAVSAWLEQVSFEEVSV